MLRRSLRASRGMMPAFSHSPCDDLESFVWVTIWTVMEKAENANDVLTLTDEDIFRDLCSLEIPLVILVKLTTRGCCSEKDPFLMKEMLREWFLFLDGKKLEETNNDDWRDVYDGFLEIGFRHLKENELWSSWEVFFKRYAELNSGSESI